MWEFISGIVSGIISWIVEIIVLIVGFILAIFFVLLPTSQLDPVQFISYIESDLCLDLPENYQILEKYADNLGFDESVSLTLQFDQENFQALQTQTSSTECASGKWIQENNNLNFELAQDFRTKNNYYFEATINPENRTLEYNYGSF